MIEGIQKSKWMIVFLIGILFASFFVRHQIRSNNQSLSITLTNDEYQKKETSVMFEAAKREAIAQSDSAKHHKKLNHVKDSIISLDKGQIKELKALIKKYEAQLDSNNHPVVKYDDYRVHTTN